VLVGEGGDLGEMGDAEDLLAAARKLQEIAGVTGPSEPLPEGL